MSGERALRDAERRDPARPALEAVPEGPLRITQVGADRREEWDAFAAAEPSFALMQSWRWGEFKERSGWRAFRVAAERGGRIVAGAQMLLRPAPLGLSAVAYIPRGPVGAWLDEEIAAPLLDGLHQVARRHRALVLRIEPSAPNDSGCAQTLQRLGFVARKSANQPRATIVLDLEPGTDRLLTQMSRSTRHNIRLAAKKGVTVRVGGAEDLPMLHQLMRTTARRAGFRPRTSDYYRSQWEILAPTGHLRLFVASHEGRPLAVDVSTVFGEHAASLHAASSNEHKDLRPNHLLMWEAVRWAEAEGCRTFDLWGIPDEVGVAASEGRELPEPTSTDGLWGVYRFKRGFGGRVICYPTAHDHVYPRPLRAVLRSRRPSG